MRTIKRKRSELPQIYNDLLNAMQLPGQKFSYAVYKNKEHIISELKSIQEGRKEIFQQFPLGDVTEYEKERIEICNTLCKKDESGNPIIENGRYIPENPEQWNTAFTKLNEKYPAIADQLKKRDQAEIQYMEESVDVLIHEVNEADVSPYITGNHREALSFMLSDNKSNITVIH